jgi:hypothetical protein
VVTLLVKYYLRKALWADLFPVASILFELVVPFDLTVVPFFFIANSFSECSRFLPLTDQTIRAANVAYTKVTCLNNCVCLITGVCWFCVIGLVVGIYRMTTGNDFDGHVLAEFGPLLLWSIAVGNLGMCLVNRWPRLKELGSVIYNGLFGFIIFSVFLITCSAQPIQLFSVLACGLITTLISYYFIHEML